MSVSSSSPRPNGASARYTVTGSDRILDHQTGKLYFFGNADDGARGAYTFEDAWAVCDWLNGRPANPVRLDHRDLATA